MLDSLVNDKVDITHSCLTPGAQGSLLTRAVSGMSGLRTLIIQQFSATIAFDHSFWATVGQTCLMLEKLYFSGGPNCLQCHEATPGESMDLQSVGNSSPGA